MIHYGKQARVEINGDSVLCMRDYSYAAPNVELTFLCQGCSGAVLLDITPSDSRGTRMEWTHTGQRFATA
jgi:hypothetical protein